MLYDVYVLANLNIGVLFGTHSSSACSDLSGNNISTIETEALSMLPSLEKL